MSRQPRAFDIDETPENEPGGPGRDGGRPPRAIEVEIEPDAFPLTPIPEPEPLAGPSAPKRHWSISLLKIALSAIGGFLLLAFGHWAWATVMELVAANPWLGLAAATLLVVGMAAALIWLIKELVAIARLKRIDALRSKAETAREERDAALAASVAAELVALYRDRPETARGRTRLGEIAGEIVDADDRLAIAERTLMAPLDARAKHLIGSSAKRVSVVTAISPRALIDVAFVAVECVRMIRRVSVNYGGRPGFFGSFRLIRSVFAHLAVTGGMAMGDDLVQQILGHGLAARLSTRLGEGVLNGLLTARVGQAAILACRPLPFVSETVPTINEVAGTLFKKDEMG